MSELKKKMEWQCNLIKGRDEHTETRQNPGNTKIDLAPLSFPTTYDL